MLSENESEMGKFKDNIRDKVIHNLKKVISYIFVHQLLRTIIT